LKFKPDPTITTNLCVICYSLVQITRQKRTNKMQIYNWDFCTSKTFGGLLSRTQFGEKISKEFKGKIK
jgi:hypothetical protein